MRSLEFSEQWGLGTLADAPERSNAEVLDVLYAVALGEGFIAGVHQFKDELITGELLALGESGQGFYRVLLAFLIVILSWLHYRRSTLVRPAYPSPEFFVDIVIILIYMSLFLFYDAPFAYYCAIAAIWVLYVVARVDEWRRSVSYLLFGLAFIGFFVSIAATASNESTGGTEWLRLLLVTAGVAIYRPLDGRFLQRLESQP